MFSIIIVNYKTWEFIERNLESIMNTAPKDISLEHWPFEVIVVDNSPDDEGLDSFTKKFPMVKIKKIKGNFGYSHACNIGASRASSDLFLFMNPDIICEWNHLLAFTQGAVDQVEWQILSAPQYGVKPRRLQRTFAPFINLFNYFPIMRILLRILFPKKYINPRVNPDTLKEILDVDWVSGSLLLISRENFNKINGWDEDYWLYCEDQDICKRAKDIGMKVGYYPFVSFIHSHASSTRRNMETKVLTKSETIISTYLYLQKHKKSYSDEILAFYIKARALISYPYFVVLDFITFKTISHIKQKKLINKRLWHYFKKVTKTNNAVSDMSISFVKGR